MYAHLRNLILKHNMSQWLRLQDRCDQSTGSLLAALEPSWPGIKVPGRSGTYIKYLPGSCHVT